MGSWTRPGRAVRPGVELAAPEEGEAARCSFPAPSPSPSPTPRPSACQTDHFLVFKGRSVGGTHSSSVRSLVLRDPAASRLLFISISSHSEKSVGSRRSRKETRRRTSALVVVHESVDRESVLVHAECFSSLHGIEIFRFHCCAGCHTWLLKRFSSSIGASALLIS